MPRRRPHDDLQVLYRSAPEGFIAARNALASRLKEEGRNDEAAAVKALRKPTVPAWALNQLAERDEAGLRALIDAGVELRAAQQAALSSGRSAERLREATAARRKLVAGLVRIASEALHESGRAPDPYIDEMRGTLEAASLDSEAAERLRSGTLERPIAEPAGFGDMIGLQSVPTGVDTDVDGGVSPGARRSSARRSLARPKAERSPAERDAELQAELRRLRRDRETAAGRAHASRATADRIGEQITRMQMRVDDLLEKRREADDRARDDEQALARAGEELERVAARLEGRPDSPPKRRG